MSLLRFLYTRLLGIGLFGLADVLLSAFLYFAGAPMTAVCIAAVAAAACGLAGLAVAYLCKRARVKRLQRAIDGLDRPELLGEVLPPPPDSEDRTYYDAMKTVSRAALTVAADAEKEKDDYRAFVEEWTHELKTPLTAMGLIVDNGCDRQKLRRELERADNTVEQVLYYARSVAPDRDLTIVKTDLGATVKTAIGGLTNILIAARIGLTVEGAGEAYTDPKWIRFIVRQLLLNCAQYTPAGGKITVTVSNAGVTVADTGIGIPSEDLPRVTERGFTGSNGRKRGNSTGMGLYIVDRLCRHLGADLRIDSAVGTGTTVTVGLQA